MAIHDSDPDRRNLVVTSTAFILFYLADGHMTPDAIRLQIVPVTFENVFVLKIFAWVILFWFGLRYWQTHRQSYRNAYLGHLKEFGNANDSGAKYIEKTDKIPKFNENNGFRENILRWQGEGPKLHIEYKIVEEFTKDNNGGIHIKKQRNVQAQKLRGRYGVWLKTKYLVSFVIQTPGFTSYAVPYILFVSAIAIPILKQYGYL